MKAISSFQSYLKYLFLLGPILLIVGLVAGLVSGNWSFFPAGIMVAIGLIINILWLGFLGGGFWQKRSTRVQANALVATVAMVAILVTVNFLATRYLLRVDLTENQLYTLSSQTQQIVKNLQQPLKIWVFDRTPDPQLRELFENYRRYNSELFQFEFVDPQIKIELAEKFQVKSLGEVYLEYGSKKKLISGQSLNNRFSPQNEPLSESKLTNAIENILRDRPLYVYFLQGHGEATLQGTEGGLLQAATSLQDTGYQVDSLNLVEVNAIPENANAIVIADPKRELLQGEVKLLQDYLNAGGNLLLMLEPENNGGLEPILDNWGVKLDDRTIIDASGRSLLIGFGVDTILITEYGDHPITNDFGEDISLYYRARPIATVENYEGVKATPLLITSDRSWAESELSSEVKFDPDKDIEGPLDLAVAIKKSDDKSQEKTEPRLIVIGDSTFATNGWFTQQRNSDVFLNSINWLASDDDTTLSIRPKEDKNRRINLSDLQAGIIGLMATLIVPLFGLIVAGVIWWRRR